MSAANLSVGLCRSKHPVPFALMMGIVYGGHMSKQKLLLIDA